MSRVGNNPIKIPSEVKVVIEPDRIHVDGKLGKLCHSRKRENYSDITWNCVGQSPKYNKS